MTTPPRTTRNLTRRRFTPAAFIVVLSTAFAAGFIAALLICEVM